MCRPKSDEAHNGFSNPPARYFRRRNLSKNRGNDTLQVFQTGDLGNLARLDAGAASKLPTLMKLKSELYSEEMRAFMKDVSGCGDLSDKIDCSCNVYADGGHLLCHDDVIGEIPPRPTALRKVLYHASDVVHPSSPPISEACRP